MHLSLSYFRDYCSVLHHFASRTRQNTLRSTSCSLQTILRCAATARYRSQYCLVGLLTTLEQVKDYSRLKLPKLHDHVPGSSLLLDTGTIPRLPSAGIRIGRPSLGLLTFQGLSWLRRSTGSQRGSSAHRRFPGLSYLLLLASVLPIAS